MALFLIFFGVLLFCFHRYCFSLFLFNLVEFLFNFTNTFDIFVILCNLLIQLIFLSN